MNDGIFESRLNDMAIRAERNFAPVFSSFLDERQCAEAEKWCLHNTNGLEYVFWGGYENARRKMVAIYPNFYEKNQIVNEFPMHCLTFSFRDGDKLTHRDFLGSFMALRLKREVIGDIVIDNGKAQTFVTDIASKVISLDITKIGRIGVKIFNDVPFELESIQKFQDIAGTVASLRLDCIVNIAAKISREKAANLIRSEKVDVNHLTVNSVSSELQQGDVISIRGCGRFLLAEIGSYTKKGRIHINLRKYI